MSSRDPADLIAQVLDIAWDYSIKKLDEWKRRNSKARWYYHAHEFELCSPFFGTI
jgi:hypothetical protein